MILASEINISLSFSPILLAVAVIVSILFSIWIYRVTLPKISTPLKLILTLIRSFAIALIIVAIFEPVVSLINKEDLKPSTLIFVDNSTSMKNYSSADSSKIISEVNNIKNNIDGNTEFFTFGKSFRNFGFEESDDISFSDSLTDFSQINKTILEKKENTSSVILISDGNYNSGSDPSYELSKLGIPIFTIGVGNLSDQTDIEIRKVLYNKFLYTGTESVIKAVILNKGFYGKNANVILKENNSIIDRSEIQLSENGINYAEFKYTPETSGEKKLTVEISSFNDESSLANNSKSFFINVIENKLNISIISSAPSADAKFIYNSLKEDSELQLTRSIQISENKYLDDFNNEEIKEADILYLIGFPGKNSPQKLIDIVKEKLTDINPFLIVVNENTDLKKLNTLSEFLPFSVSRLRDDYTRVFIDAADFNSPLLGKNLEERTSWNNFPPLIRNNSNFSSKPGSNVIAKLKIGNTAINEPLILTSNSVGQKSIAIIAGEIWKLKLNDKENCELLFDNFFNTSVKWLRDESRKNKFQISSDKKIYSTAERIFLTSELYDEALNPLPTAEIEAKLINSNNEVIPFRFNYGTNGLYEYTFDNLSTGNYRVEAKALVNNSFYAESNYSLSVENTDIEKNNLLMNYELLNNLASVSNGNFYYLEDVNNIYESVNNINGLFQKEKIEKTEFKFWSNEIILILIILLFSFEWFIRKRSGMI